MRRGVESEDKETTATRQPSQITNAVLMVSPDTFGFNPETASTNIFSKNTGEPEEEIRNKALQEFNSVVTTLRSHGIQVFVCPSREDVPTPDAVFPNNWFTTHEDGRVILYPLLTESRRNERQWGYVAEILGVKNQTRVIDLTYLEPENLPLEGTGSIVFYHKGQVMFTMLSPRTSISAIMDFGDVVPYEPVIFHAQEVEGKPIYHTNVVLSIGDGFAVVCLEAIAQENRDMVEGKIRGLGLELVPITLFQMRAFCANILHLESVAGQRKIVMSETAYNAFDTKQLGILQKYGQVVTLKIPTIETVGGGSARCMLAEIFLPQIKDAATKTIYPRTA